MMTERLKNISARAILRKICMYLPTPAQTGAWAAIMLFASVTLVALLGRDTIVAPPTAETAYVEPRDLAYLSAADQGLYTMIQLAQSKAEFSKANRMMHQLSNRGLLGYMLAERYLAANYTASAEELTQWLAAYGDHPQAGKIAGLAVRRGAKVELADNEQPLKGEGYSDHLGRSSMPDSWFTGIAHWRDGEYSKASEIFTRISENEDLGSWHRAAAHFWAYRADDARGEKSSARVHLKEAASFHDTFYGLLASAKLGTLNVEADAPEVSDTLRDDPRAIRAALLVQLGDSDAAETELRALYAASDKSERAGIITLSSELNLSNLQLRLARMPGLSEEEARFARYPMPHYMVGLHEVMDSALLLAVARNESGFREVAKSPAGAVGMMQMLPSTARAVEKHVGEDLLRVSSMSDVNAPISERLSDPALSARYGAEYLKLVAREKSVEGNLIHLLVGYNAGVGRVISWKAMGGQMKDPLLYIESMPFNETRNYVMQVSAQYWIYQLMMDEQPTTLKTLAKGQWPKLPAVRS